jgi:hypothetical protein
MQKKKNGKPVILIVQVSDEMKLSFIAEQNGCGVHFSYLHYEGTSSQNSVLLHELCSGVCTPQLSFMDANVSGFRRLRTIAKSDY